MTRLATARCVLRPVTDADAPALHRQWNHPEVGRYLWDRRPVSPEQVAEVLRESHAAFAETGWGLWAVCVGDALVGCCGLRVSRQGDGIELLYALDRAAWGRGYALEAARAVLDHATATLGLPRVVAAANPANQASWRILERLGMRRTGAMRTEIEDLWLYST